MKLDATERQVLLDLARASIHGSLVVGGPTPPPQAAHPPALRALRSSFVTIRMGADLRGCCGTLDAPRPLAEDVWRNAWASAFQDPRFPALSSAEWAHCHLHVSVLTPPTPLFVDSERQLLAELRPGVDGLILQMGAARATFLPAVWEQIEDATAFVRRLKLKAGWPETFWSPRISVWRYEAENFGEEFATA